LRREASSESLLQSGHAGWRKWAAIARNGSNNAERSANDASQGAVEAECTLLV
jgi:hypothetical protein